MLHAQHIKAVILGVIICFSQAFQKSQFKIASEFWKAVSISSSNDGGAKSLLFKFANTVSSKPKLGSLDTEPVRENQISSEFWNAISVPKMHNVGTKSNPFNVASIVSSKPALESLDSPIVYHRLDLPVPLSSSLSVVYNANDIASYFTRNPSLVVGRVIQIVAEIATILMAAMESRLQEGADTGSVATPTLRKGRVKLATAITDSMIRMVRVA